MRRVAFSATVRNYRTGEDEPLSGFAQTSGLRPVIDVGASIARRIRLEWIAGPVELRRDPAHAWLIFGGTVGAPGPHGLTPMALVSFRLTSRPRGDS